MMSELRRVDDTLPEINGKMTNSGPFVNREGVCGVANGNGYTVFNNKLLTKGGAMPPPPVHKSVCNTIVLNISVLHRIQLHCVSYDIQSLISRIF